MTIAALESLSFGLGRMAAAAAEAGHELCLLTADRSVYRHELGTLPDDALTVIDVDTFDETATRRALAALPDLVGLLNTTDTWSVPAADLAAEFGLPGPDPAAVRLLRDKYQVRELLHRRGLSRSGAVRVAPSPGSADEVVRAVGLPAVLKDSSGTSSRNVWIVQDEEALRRTLDEAAQQQFMGELFAEAFLAGPLYSAETLSWDGVTRLLGVLSRQTSRQPAVREEAAAFPVALPQAESNAIEQWVGDVLNAAGHRSGFAHVEFVLTTEGPELVEINRRIGGALVGEVMCRSLGTNVYTAMVEEALGRRPRLMDAPLDHSGPAHAFVLVYADRPGVLKDWHGLDELAAFPGNVRWYPTRAPGDVVPQVGDQRGCTGIVLAEAATAELAQHRAWSAATRVRPVVADSGP
ncbi:Biotin carboxylase [Saccharopolyspora antimicrobica]|uniref:Biotin carboxylase n=1 Tax=Saccharopolyspora antimicrobica TaxID=455193 RepID=A0A1I5G299_9PSEU|nr:ATP-grasp domain-containing protein [Saccharopolyspora antimicrobica]RKT83964.1 biotin carboxylase [Saccharopolyspora antimicrobica]SFO30009.1 Biotin carboxylase [Saccharopolyspora antimicrobica]